MTSSSCSGNFQASHIRQCHRFLWSLVPAIVKEESVYRIRAKGWRMTIPPLWSNCCFSQLNGGFIPWKLRPVARADKPRQSAPSSSLLPTKEVSIIVIVHVTKGSCDKMQSKQAFPRRVTSWLNITPPAPPGTWGSQTDASLSLILAGEHFDIIKSRETIIM